MIGCQRALVHLALAALLLGCQRDNPDSPAGEVRETISSSTAESEEASSPPSATESTTLSFVVPASIDVPYVERVLQALYDVEGEAGRAILSSGGVSDPARTHLRAIYDASQLEQRVDLYEQQAVQGFPDTLPSPGNVQVRVADVISADPGCVFAAGIRDFSEVVTQPRDRSGEVDFFQLLPIDDGQDPENLNPTPWVLGGSEVRSDGSEPDNPCEL